MPVPAHKAPGRVRAGRWIVAAVTAALLLVLAVGAAWAAGEQLRRAGLSAGGARLEQGGYVLQSAVGQPVSGILGQGATSLCVGLLCGEQERHIYLPVVSK